MNTKCDFVSELQKFKMENDIHFKTSFNSVLYIFDLKRYTIMSSIKLFPDCLTIRNKYCKKNTHICIDGGMITYGLSDYVGDGQDHERPDCMIFSKNKLFFVELKTNVKTRNDKKRWKEVSKAMRQLKEYFLFLYSEFTTDGNNINSYYASDDIKAVVCMSPKPLLYPSVNSQRLTEIEKFRQSTGGVKVIIDSEIVI